GLPAPGADGIAISGPEAFPGELSGLGVDPEYASAVENQKRPFVEAVGLYSLRQGDTLQATLQLSRFTEAANTDDERFRRSVVQQVGSTVPHEVTVGETTVFITTGRRQQVAVWFQDRTLFILGMREEYDTPRALTRAALEIKP
ncbi:MAG: hypothetical protein ACR2H3_02745, partial [Acidimicrobiales bacterium]